VTAGHRQRAHDGFVEGKNDAADKGIGENGELDQKKESGRYVIPSFEGLAGDLRHLPQCVGQAAVDQAPAPIAVWANAAKSRGLRPKARSTPSDV